MLLRQTDRKMSSELSGSISRWRLKKKLSETDEMGANSDRKPLDIEGVKP